MKYRFLKYRALQGKVTGKWYVGVADATVDAPAGEFEGEHESVIAEIGSEQKSVPASDSGTGEQPKRKRGRRIA